MSFMKTETVQEELLVGLELDERLRDMLSFARPHGSLTLKGWVKFFIEHPYMQRYEIKNKLGERLALVIEVPKADGTASKIMFSCHVDTIHRNEGKQEIKYDPTVAMVYKDDKEPLGADDTAGVWLMLEMIDAGVPGVYFFHEGEERGGWGSRQISMLYPDFLNEFDHAIAFDRRGTEDVITHQGISRCCSDEFATELADRLSYKTGYELKPCDMGIFTDTKNYIDDIPECTNISVGYYDEHSPREMLDFTYLTALREAVCDPETWKNLPVKRDPAEVDIEFTYYGGRDYTGYKAPQYNVYADVGPDNLRDMSKDDITEWLYNVDAEDAAEIIWLATR